MHVCTFNKISFLQNFGLLTNICTNSRVYCFFILVVYWSIHRKQTKITANHAYPNETINVSPQLGKNHAHMHR